MLNRLSFICSVALFACPGAKNGVPDAGDSPADSGTHVRLDAGSEDAGTNDAGALDAGFDAGVTIGPWTTTLDCTATLDALALINSAAVPRGTILGCADGGALDQATTQSTMNDKGAEGVVAQTGVTIIKFAYQTARSDGTPAVSLATAYLPQTPRAVPAPLVLIGRPTSGIADSCAPIRDDLPSGNLVLPFAGRGFIAVTPDFSGLGNAGTHAYLDNHEAAGQLFDAATAIQNLLPGNIAGEPLAAVGYSQGGGIVLSAQALEFSLTGRRRLRGVATLAPEWPISAKSFSYADLLRNPNGITALAGLSTPTVLVLRHYGFMANHTATPDGAFPAAEKQSLVSEIESLCTVPLGGALDGAQPKLGDLVDDTFRTQVLACIDGTTGCTGTGADFHAWMTADFVTADPQGARVLIAQGLADQIMPAAGEAACDVAKLRAEGIEPELCIDTLATHDTVLEKRIEDVVAWIEAVATGAQTPTCSSAQLPACNR